MNTRVIASHRILFLLLSFVLLLAACGQQSTTTGSTSTQATPTPTPALDVYGTPIAFPKTPPQRIVSLVPSMSEILGALHLDSRVVGIDYYTNYPASLTSRPKVSNANCRSATDQPYAVDTRHRARRTPDLDRGYRERAGTAVAKAG